jgi:outer membrane receptor protein involved in Fe transport
MDPHTVSGLAENVQRDSAGDKTLMQRRRIRLFRQGLVTAILALIAGLPPSTYMAFGQGITTGTISGITVDASDAAVPGAQVTAESNSQGTTRQTMSGADGHFSFYAMPIGQYTIRIDATGFANATVNAVQVNAGATSNLNSIKLALPTANTQVEVNGAASALLQTSDSQVTTTFTAEQIQNLPLNNGFDTITEVVPGIVSTHGDNFSNTNGDNYSVNGQSGRYNNSEIDGQANNDNGIGGPQVFFSNQDAIQEIQVISNNFSAQYGRNAGAVVNYITKAGTNSLHGTGFEYYQSQFLSAFENQQKSPAFGFCAAGQNPSSGCEAPLLPRFAENRYGGTIGGPILRDKLFFFGSTYWDHVRVGAAPLSTLPFLSPTPAGVQQLQSAFPGAPAIAALSGYGPFSVKAGNPVVSPVPSAASCPSNSTFANGNCLETITGPNGNSVTVPFAGVQRSIPNLFNDEENLGRLDFQPTSGDHLFLRYFYQAQLETGEGGGENGQIANGDFVNVPSTAHSVGADWTHTFSIHWVDQLRYSFQQSKVYFEGGSYPNCLTTQITDCPSQLGFLGGNDDVGFGVNALFPQGNTVKVTQIQNNAVWSGGRHTILFGGEFDYQNSPFSGLFFYNGELEYQTFTDFLQQGSSGNAFALLANGPAVTPFTEVDAAGYVQDDWKVTPSFTAHLGMRWEFFSQAVNLLNRETVARQSNPATAFWSQSLPLSATTDPPVSNFYRGFQPRIGFAYNPDFDRKLVIRGGYAINENPAYYNLITLASDAAPVVNFGEVGCSPATPCVPGNGSLLGSAVRALNLPSLPGGDPRAGFEQYFPTNFRPPYVQTYTLALEHQLGTGAVGEIRFVGSKTTHDFQSVDQNPYLAPVAAAFPNYVSPASLCQDPTANGFGRPNCDYNNVAYVSNGGWANYNGLLLNLTTRTYHGLTSTISYTFSKGMNNATDGFRSTGGAGSSIAYAQNPLNTSEGERGLSGNDFPNVVGISFDYKFPNVVHSGLLSRLTNGFDVYGLYRFNSGQVYTPFQPLTLDTVTGDTSFCDGGFNAQTVGADTCRLVSSNRKAPTGSVAYLNPYTGPVVGGAPTLGNPEYVVYNSDSATYDANGNLATYNPGTPVDPGSTRWIINNQAYAEAVGNPYPGSSRSLLRGQTYSELDASILKAIPITERVQVQLSMTAYNALNQMYLGTGEAEVNSSDFTQTTFNSSGSVPSGTGFISGNRFVVLGGKIVF